LFKPPEKRDGVKKLRTSEQEVEIKVKAEEKECFEIAELTFYWNVDKKKFKEKIKNYKNILIAGFPPMGNIIPYHIKALLKDSEEILSLYSYNFPPMVEAREEEFEIPHDEIWYSEEKKLF